MINSKLIHYGSVKVTRLILYGSLGVSIVLTLLLICYDLLVLGYFRARTIVGFFLIIYLLVAWVLSRKKLMRIVSWMLVILYMGLSFSCLLYWGLNTAAGIFATSFVIILAGILLGSRAILPVTLCIAFLLVIIQIIHSSGIITPDLSSLTDQSSFYDVVSYITIFGVFSFITWISGNQIEKTLTRAKKAEATLRIQKDTLAIELERESARLHTAQMEEIQHLYKFATVGQSTSATLHELSNHLSVLNMDIDDLKQQHKNSAAIANAKEGIEQINLMVRQARRKLESYDDRKTFNGIRVARRAVKDLEEKFRNKNVSLEYVSSGRRTANITGDPMALMQTITILLNNALDACYELPNCRVEVRIRTTLRNLEISIIDNGIGISEEKKKSLFSPSQSSKPAGLGVGLYIARHLVESQFNGTLQLVTHSKEPVHGAHFLITLGIKSKI